jgi:hypothetical protein
MEGDFERFAKNRIPIWHSVSLATAPARIYPEFAVKLLSPSRTLDRVLEGSSKNRCFRS